MACKQFRDWLKAIGPVEAAKRISEHEVSRMRPGLTYQAIQDWLDNDIPPTRVAAVSAVSGISRNDLRPDVFGEADHAAA